MSEMMNKETAIELAKALEREPLAVHNGPFHADDVVTVALLRTLGGARDVVRTRDPEVLRARVGIDVAGSRTGSTFDHHGEAAVPGVCALTKVWAVLRVGGVSYQDACDRFDHMMGPVFQAIADIDSGATRNPASRPHMFAWVSMMNDGSDATFFKCVEMAQAILEAAWAKAEEWGETLEEARNALTWDGTPPVLEKERGGMKEALHYLKCEAPFFVSPHGDEWAVIQTCPPDVPFNPFGNSKALPAEWGGLRGKDLQDVSGYASAVFAFAPGMGPTVMAFFRDKKDAIACAEKACAE